MPIESTPIPERGPDRRRRSRLVRPRRRRWVGGVCSGLGAHFDVDPILFRIAFVGLAVFSGVGIVLYLAILLLVPEEGLSRAPLGMLWRGSGSGSGSGGGQWQESADRRLLRWLARAVAIVVCAALLAVAGVWLGGTDGTLAAWLVLALGAVLVLGAFTRRARWLMLPFVAFAIAVTVIAAAHVDLHGGTGERRYRPLSLGEVRRDYELGAGRLEVDLRGIAFPPGVTSLHVRLGMGQIVVLVPRNVCVATSARIGGGYVGALEQRSGGLDVAWSERPAPSSPRTPRLVLDGSVGLGALLVADHPIEHAGNGWRGWGGWGDWRGGGGWFGSHVHREDLGTNVACDASTGAGQ